MDNEANQKPKRGNRALRWAKTLLVILSFTYGFVLLMLYVNESFLVYPGSTYPRGNWQPDKFVFEEIQFEASDGTQLVAWYLPYQHGTPKNNVLICHGNAENVAQVSNYMGRQLAICLEANVLVYDYRGFGKSQGSPDEAGLKLDSDAALKLLNQKTGTQPGDIIIVGHSLGGGPAVYLAGTHGAKALVLQRTFKSLVEAGQYNYPWVPVSLLMRNRFECDSITANLTMPIFQSHGDRDSVVPIESARNLHECAASQTKYFYEIPGMRHYDPLPVEYWTKLREFINAACPQ